jgi:hypothetical protein
MKRFNKLVVMGLVAIMSVTAALPVLATEQKELSHIQDDSFDITTTINEKHQVIRTFERNIDNEMIALCNADEDKNNGYKETKELLIDLGMEQYAIDNLTNEDLERYARSPKIVTSVTYSKIDSEGKEIYLDESVAIQEASVIQKIQEDKIQNKINGIETLEQDTYEDSYMRVFHSAVNNWNETITFTTDARWLTMPFYRSNDSIGSAAQGCTVINDSRSGYIEYDTRITGFGYSDVYSEHKDLPSSQFQLISDGTFFGTGAVVKLPVDADSATQSVYNTNYKAHFQYSEHIMDPSFPHWYQTVGSYSHSRKTVVSDVSLGIGLKGVTGGISIKSVDASDVRYVSFDFHYE